MWRGNELICFFYYPLSHPFLFLTKAILVYFKFYLCSTEAKNVSSIFSPNFFLRLGVLNGAEKWETAMPISLFFYMNYTGLKDCSRSLHKNSREVLLIPQWQLNVPFSPCQKATTSILLSVSLSQFFLPFKLPDSSTGSMGRGEGR